MSATAKSEPRTLQLDPMQTSFVQFSPLSMKRSFEEVTPSVSDGVPSSSTKKPVPEADPADVSLTFCTTSRLIKIFENYLKVCIHSV